MGRQHQSSRLELRLEGQRQVDGHLVAVEVGVERRARQRVQTNGLALDQHRLERLDAQSVERRCSVEQNGMLLDNLFENVPHLGTFLFDQLFGAFDRLHVVFFLELPDDKRLEQLERHALGQTTLVNLEFRPDNDHGTPGVIDSLAEEVLAESPLLALEHVAETFQRAVALAADRARAAAVVE